MSSIQVAGSFANYVPSGTFLGNVSLDISGRTFLRNDTLINGKLFVNNDISFNGNLAVNGPTNINTTGTSITNIGGNTITSGDTDIRGNNISITAYNSLQLEATNGFWTNVGAGNFYYRANSGNPNIIIGSLSTDYLYISSTATGSSIDADTYPLSLYGTGIYMNSGGNITQEITDTTLINNPSTTIQNQILGDDKLTITTSTITNNPTTTIKNQIGGVDRLTITDVRVDNNPTTDILNRIGGVNKLSIFSTSTILDQTTSITTRIGGNDRITVTNTNVTANPTTQFQVDIATVDKLTITSTDTTLDPNNTFTFCPTATIITRVVATVPSGFLACVGGTQSRTTYARLFGVIGTTYGAGDGSTTFGIPDFEGCFLRGAGTQTIGGVAYTAGAVGTAQQDSVLEAYNEGYWNVDAGGGGSNRAVRSRVQITGDPEDTGGNSTTKFLRQNNVENRPVNHAVYYFIRF